MPKNHKKIKKTSGSENKNEKEEVKKVVGEEEETEKESGTLSDGVLDAFEEVAPVDPLLEVEDETLIAAEESEEDDELDSGDYKANDEW